MNVNEVISNRAIEMLGGDRFAAEKSIHPNDHVNMGQSTNDTFPTAIHVAVAMEIQNRLLPALKALHESLVEKATKWDRIIKIGRTHLMDATPLRLGQEFGGFARQIELSIRRAEQARDAVLELPVGGTAVGSGINTAKDFGNRVAAILAEKTGIGFIEAVNHFEANGQRDGVVDAHGSLKTIAQTMFGIANNIRWLGSGPRCGFFEVILPDRQPGSSIMPGKVNPVMCESMMQLCARVIGNDACVTTCGATGGNFQLNIMMPVMGQTTLESIELLAAGIHAFIEFCISGLEANESQCQAMVEQSLSMSTSLNPLIGYEAASKLVKEAFARGKTIRELCKEKGLLDEATLDQALDPWKMTEPQ
jgi:fumarate hydratase class II